MNSFVFILLDDVLQTLGHGIIWIRRRFRLERGKRNRICSYCLIHHWGDCITITITIHTMMLMDDVDVPIIIIMICTTKHEVFHSMMIIEHVMRCTRFHLQQQQQKSSIIQDAFYYLTDILEFQNAHQPWDLRLLNEFFSVCTLKVRIVNNTLAFSLGMSSSYNVWVVLVWSGHRQDLSKTIYLNIAHKRLWYLPITAIAHLPMRFISLVGCLDCQLHNPKPQPLCFTKNPKKKKNIDLPTDHSHYGHLECIRLALI